MEAPVGAIAGAAPKPASPARPEPQPPRAQAALLWSRRWAWAPPGSSSLASRRRRVRVQQRGERAAGGAPLTLHRGTAGGDARAREERVRQEHAAQEQAAPQAPLNAPLVALCPHACLITTCCARRESSRCFFAVLCMDEFSNCCVAVFIMFTYQTCSRNAVSSSSSALPPRASAESLLQVARTAATASSDTAAPGGTAAPAMRRAASRV